MQKLKMHSLNKVEKNIEAIGAMFPNCLTERMGENGEVEVAIDFDVLRQELSSVVVEGAAERYQFTWPEKRKSMLLANAPIAKTLRPCREESKNFDTTENLYIEGDNLDVLKLLQETYLGKVKMIYIDPPYNTGKDTFVYNDDFAIDSDEWSIISGDYEDGSRMVKNVDSNGRFHTDWLNMVYPRLKVARDLLTDDGVIFISIDDNEVENLKKICDEVFGSSNFVALLPRITKKAGKTTDAIAKNTDYVICFQKSNLTRFNTYKHNDEGYKHKDEYLKERGLYKLSQTLDYGSIQYSPSLDYEIELDATVFRPGNVSKEDMLLRQKRNPKSDFCWRWSKDLFEFGLLYGFIVVKGSRIYTKTYQNATISKGVSGYEINVVERTKPATTLDYIENEFSNDNSKKDLSKLFESKIFDYSKPISLLHSLSYLSTDRSSIVLDFFSGSATTAHAVMQLNAEDGGNRKFIMVQLPEETDEKSEARKAGYKNICEIGKERIRRAGDKIVAESKKKTIATDSSQTSIGWAVVDGNNRVESMGAKIKSNPKDINIEIKLKDTSLDTGFRVLKLDSTNMKDVYYNPQDYSTQLFAELESNIKEDRTPEDLLFQVMLDLGVLLSAKIEESEIAGKKVFNVNDGYLIACFDDNVTEETVTAIAKLQPYYFAMRDSSMATDSVATNFEQIFETYSKDTIRKIL